MLRNGGGSEIVYCCPARPTVTRTKTKLVGPTALIKGTLLYDDGQGGTVPMANQLIVLQQNLARSSPLVPARTQTDALGNFKFILKAIYPKIWMSVSLQSVLNKPVRNFKTDALGNANTLATVIKKPNPPVNVTTIVSGPQSNRILAEGTAQPNIRINLHANGVKIGTALSDSKGTYKVLSEPLAFGFYLVSVMAVDSRGVDSDELGAGTVTIFPQSSTSTRRTATPSTTTSATKTASTSSVTRTATTSSATETSTTYTPSTTSFTQTSTTSATRTTTCAAGVFAGIAANQSEAISTYKAGGSSIGNGTWKVYTLQAPADLCVDKPGSIARLTSANIALAHNTAASPVTQNATLTVALLDVANTTNGVPVWPPNFLASTNISVQVPYCSGCTPSYPSPSTKPEYNITLGNATSGLDWLIEPNQTFGFGLITDNPAPGTLIKWANVVSTNSSDDLVAGRSGFSYVSGWANDPFNASSGWFDTGASYNNLFTLLFECFCP